jgi:Fe-S-cluster containining protein
MDLTPSEPCVEFRLNLAQGESRSVVTAAVPKRALVADELLPVLYRIDDAAVALAEVESRRDGKEVSCRVGCAACCRQLIPVSEHEARRIADLVAALPDERRREVEERFERVVGELASRGLADRLLVADQVESEDDRAELGHEYFALRLDCPFLEDERCTIYADRPIACREYLVTSPPENCWSPESTPVDAAAVSTHFSAALYRFREDGSGGVARWMPLVYSLRVSSSQPPAPAATMAGPDLFRQFMRLA